MHPKPKFQELAHLVASEEYGGVDGYVIKTLWKDGRWLYKLSIAESETETYDNWIREEHLSLFTR
jgi:hypothetical protein